MTTLEDRVFLYKSPKAFDFENQEVTMRFSGLDSIGSMVRIQQKYAEQVYELIIDKTQIQNTTAGVYSLEVELIDTFKKANLFTQKINIEWVSVESGFEALVETNKSLSVEEIEPKGEMPADPVT